MRSTLLVSALTLTALSSLAAQARTAPSLSGPCGPSTAPYLIVNGVCLGAMATATNLAEPQTLQLALRNLVVAEEGFWADHGTYTTDVSQLGIYQRKAAPTDSVWVQVLFAGGRSWSGRALMPKKESGKSCVVYVGYLTDFPSPPVTERDSVRATKEGLPTCDKF